MKAAYFMKTGGPEVLQYGDVADPVAGPGQVLVDVHAASVNGADWKVRTGSYAPPGERELVNVDAAIARAFGSADRP